MDESLPEDIYVEQLWHTGKMSAADMAFFESCAQTLHWDSGALPDTKPDAITLGLVGRALCYVFLSGDTLDDTSEQGRVISVGRVTKVYKQTLREYRRGFHAEARFSDDSGPRDVSLTLEAWNALLGEPHQWILLKPRRNRVIEIMS